MSTVYTFAGGKGGTGKTTVTANVATALSAEGYDVAAVDVDLRMPNLGQLFEIAGDGGVHEVLAGEATVADVSVHSKHGPAVVPGSMALESVEQADPSNLRRALNSLTDRHEVVLLDTGPGLSHENSVAYGLADAVVLVSTPSEAATRDIRTTREMVAQVDGTVGGLVLTRSHGECDPTALANAAGTDLFGVVPEYGDAKEPRVAVEPTTPAATEYERVATSLAVYHQTGSREQALAAESNTGEADGLLQQIMDALGR
ncbi:MinD/ParA family ATP-binding protein [Halovenus halobia]|uniref:MinD/ParA family ATP-binding protein n=1 Tax=Halovenus halobia TaxID=3396622 RepID=UPI003F56E038